MKKVMVESEESKPKKKMLPREALVIPPVKRSETHSAYYTQGDKSASPNLSEIGITGCMGNQFQKIYDYKEMRTRIWVRKDHNFTIKDIAHWVMFINRCGFKCKFEEVDDPSGTYIASIYFRGEDYITPSQYITGLTSARYCCMHYYESYHEIPSLATKLYAEHPELDAHQALILAHLAQSKGSYFDSGHGTVRFGEGLPLLLTREQMEKRFKKIEAKSVINKACTEYLADSNVGDWCALARTGKIDKVIEKTYK